MIGREYGFESKEARVGAFFSKDGRREDGLESIVARLDNLLAREDELCRSLPIPPPLTLPARDPAREPLAEGVLDDGIPLRSVNFVPFP